MSDTNDFLATPGWYPRLGAYSAFTTFVGLPDDALSYLASTDRANFEDARGLEQRMKELLQRPLEAFSGYVFASVDRCAPTDTERFRDRYGAVHRPEQVWNILCASEKVRQSAAEGKVSCICLRPYRRMNVTREFRLFIRNGELIAMSQYHLIRHFRRLEGVRDKYWGIADRLIRQIGWMLQLPELVMDIYISSDGKVRIIDLNPWGRPTDPLLLRTWDRDWSEPGKCLIVPAPRMVSGDVNVHF